jgi:hypothetical protein
MKILLSFLLTAFGIQVATAQNNIVKGSVQGEGGKLLHYVLVGDNKYNNVAFTDSVGDFTIAAHPDSKLLFQVDGYRDTLIDASAISQNPQVSLVPMVKLPIETIGLGMPTIITGDGNVAVVRRNTALEGSRYLFETFVPGYFTYSAGKKFYNKRCLFNYEKMSGFVLLTVDKRSVREVDRDQIKSFSLYDKTDQRYDFEQVPEVDKFHYLQVLASGPKYKIYKFIKTSFIASGVAHTASGDRGQDYDQYLDEAEYYVLNVQTNQLQKIALKKKALKDAFQKENDKVNKFMSENNGSLNDAFLGKLGTVVNS